MPRTGLGSMVGRPERRGTLVGETGARRRVGDGREGRDGTNRPQLRRFSRVEGEGDREA
jgi:hypothetical protein